MGDGDGQLVISRDQHDPDGPLVYRRITRTYQRTAYGLQVLTVRDADGTEQTLRVTEEHPFYVEFAGWTAAKLLAAGDTILGADGALAVVSNECEAHPRGVAVYNLEVEDAHTYFVMAAGARDAAVWVHNKCLIRTTDATVSGKKITTGAFAFVTAADIGTGTRVTKAGKAFANSIGNPLTDDAAHLIARILGGGGGKRSGNLTSFLSRVNRGDLATFEKNITDYIRDHGVTARIRVRLDYSGGATRPDRLVYRVRFSDGTRLGQRYHN